MAAAGLVFKRHWFEIVDAAPAEAKPVRFWDLAASEKETAKDDPDFTAGAKVSLCNRVYYIEHVIKARERWAGVKNLIGQTVELDGKDIGIGVEQEPGASGKAIIHELASWPRIQGKAGLKGYRSNKDKVKRAHKWSSQAEVGNVKIVRGNWDIEGFLNECEQFPDGPHDDQVDAVSGAIQMLTGPKAYYL